MGTADREAACMCYAPGLLYHVPTQQMRFARLRYLGINTKQYLQRVPWVMW